MESLNGLGFVAAKVFFCRLAVIRGLFGKSIEDEALVAYEGIICIRALLQGCHCLVAKPMLQQDIAPWNST